MSCILRFFIFLTILSGSTVDVRAETRTSQLCSAYIGHPFPRVELKIDYRAAPSDCPNGLATGSGTVTGQPYGSPAGTSMAVTSTFVSGKPTGQTRIRSSFGISFDGTIDASGTSQGRTVYPDTHVEEGRHVRGEIVTGTVTRPQNMGGGINYILDGQTVSESQYRASETRRQSFTNITPPAPVTSSRRAAPSITASRQAVRNCTAYISYPLEFEGIGLQYDGICPSGYAEGQQTFSTRHNGSAVQVSSFFKSGTVSGETRIDIENGINLSGIVNTDGSITGTISFLDGHSEEGNFISTRLHYGISTGPGPIYFKRYYKEGRQVSQQVYASQNPSTQTAAIPANRPSYAYTPPLVAPIQTAPSTSPARTSTRPRTLRDGECFVAPPPELIDATTTTVGECDGNQFTGKVTFTLAADTRAGLETRYIVPFRRGRASGPMSATFPSIGGIFKGSFNGINPDNGQIEIPLGNNVYQIAELQGGRWVSERTERREPGFMEQLVGAIVYQYVIPAVQQRIRQEMISGLQELRDRPERRAEYARIQAGETRQREELQARERQNAENLRLANEANARQVAEREAARAQAENDRQIRIASEETARQARVQADAQAYAERQAQSQREYAERQAQNGRDQAERERVRQVEIDQRQAERDAEARNRQMAQNEPAPFAVTTRPQEFGGSTAPPVVTTNPPERVPAPIVGTNPPSEVPPPLQSGRDLRPTIRQPDVPPPLPSGTSQPDLRPTFGTPNVTPPLDSGRGLEPTLAPIVPVPPPTTTGPTPLPSGQDLRPSFPIQPVQPVQPPTRNDTLRSGSTNSQPALTYKDVMTPSERALSARLPISLRAESQYSPEQIRLIKQDGRWQNWVNDANAYLAPAQSQPTRQAATPSTPQSQPTTRAVTPQLVGLTPNDRRWVSSLVRELQGQIYSLTPVQIDAMRASGRWDEIKEVFTQANGEILAANEAGAREQIAIWEKAWGDTQTTVVNGALMLVPVGRLAAAVNDIRLTARGAQIVATTPRGIGATGIIGETYLKTLGGTSQVSFQTARGARIVDQVVGTVGHEAKVGYQSLTAGISEQIAKDRLIIQERGLTAIKWHFFRSPITGQIGISAQLRQALQNAGFEIIEHSIP